MENRNSDGLEVREGDVRIISDWLIFGLFKDVA
jgi:hypothetical protein